MEVFNDAKGKPTIAVNPAHIIRADKFSKSIWVFMNTPDRAREVYPLDGETLEQAWERLTMNPNDRAVKEWVRQKEPALGGVMYGYLEIPEKS